MKERTCNIQLKHRRDYLQDVKTTNKRLCMEKSNLSDNVDSAKTDLGQNNNDIKKSCHLVKVANKAVTQIKLTKPALDQKIQEHSRYLKEC